MSHSPTPHPLPPYLTGHGAILDNGALAPGKRVLEGLEEVKDAPTDDDVVIKTDKKADLCWGLRRTRCEAVGAVLVFPLSGDPETWMASFPNQP